MNGIAVLVQLMMRLTQPPSKGHIHQKLFNAIGYQSQSRASALRMLMSLLRQLAEDPSKQQQQQMGAAGAAEAPLSLADALTGRGLLVLRCRCC